MAKSMKPKRTLLRSQLIWAIVSMLLVAFPALAQIVNTREVSAVFLVPDHTIYGTTTYSCEVDVTPTVSPYIDSSHGGSFSLSGTLNVSSSVYSVSGIQDAGVGVVLFGQNGTVGSTSNPFQGSTITIASPDYWYSGTYQAIVNDYNSQAPFTLNFGITGGPFSLSISPNNNSPITLNGPSGNGQILMADAATAPPGHTRYSGVFASGEGITLESFQILEGANGGEIGNITLTIPLTGGHTWYNYSTLSPVLDSLTTGQTITVPLSYVRGDKIPPPTVQATASAYQINPGQAITLSVTVNNPSQVVPIAGGQVTISSYGPTLTNATGQSSVTNFGVISPQSSQTYYFHIAGSQAGTVAPLVQLTYQYGYPATAKTTLPINASVPNITVTPQTGSLYVTISPAGANNAGAQWQVDNNGVWHNSGTTISGLSVGGHTISFNTISGWNSPANQNVTINNGSTTTTTGTYVQQTGSLQVTISPSGAVSAGAQWQVDNGAWQNSGATVSGLQLGSHTVSFSTISGWTTPASQPVTISANQTAQPTGTYVVASQTGSLEVTISPSGAVSAGAQWQVDAGAWQNSGATISGLSVGSHTVSFSTISGWSTPTNQVATVSVNQTTQITGTYAPIPQLSVSPSTGLSASGFEGGPYTPSSLQYLLNNTATGTLNWTVSADQPWVTVSQSSGQNAGTVTVSINTNANSLVPNTYYSTLTFGGNGGSTNFQVELTIFSSGQFFIFPTCINGLQIDINGGTYAPPGGQVTNIVWNWGDGQQAPGGFPNSHTYSSAGNYTVQVTSQYSDGSSATLSQTLTVAPGALQNCVACEISASQNGAVSYQASVGSGTVSAGTSVTLQQANEADMLLTASPNSNDFFLDWSPSSGMTGINATPVTTNSPSVFIVVNNNSQIIGNFSPLSLGIGLPPWGSNGFNLLLYAPAGSNVVVQVSTNLVNWYTWTNVTIPYSPYPISDLSVTNSKYRFYRVLLSSSAIVAAQALQSYGTGSAATSMSLPAGGQLYVYGVATGGATALGAFANGQTIQITNADGIISAQLAATTNSSNNYTTSTSYHVLGGVGASGFNYAQGFYGVNLGPGPNLNASVQFTLTVPAMIAVIGMGSSQTELTLSGVGNPTIDVPVQTDVSGTEALIIAHQYLTAGTYTIQETTGDGPPIQDPNHEVDLIGVLIFSSSPNAATSSNPQIPLPPGF
jgi:hypothetical protein